MESHYFVYRFEKQVHSSLEQVIRTKNLLVDDLLSFSQMLRRFRTIGEAQTYIQAGFLEDSTKFNFTLVPKSEIESKIIYLSHQEKEKEKEKEQQEPPSVIPSNLKRSSSELPPNPNPTIKKMMISCPSPPLFISTPSSSSVYSPKQIVLKDTHYYLEEIKRSFERKSGICLELEKSNRTQTRQGFVFFQSSTHSQMFHMNHMEAQQDKQHSEVSDLIETLICAFSKISLGSYLNSNSVENEKGLVVYTSSEAMVKFYQNLFPTLKSTMILQQYIRHSVRQQSPLHSYFSDLQIVRDVPYPPDLHLHIQTHSVEQNTPRSKEEGVKSPSFNNNHTKEKEEEEEEEDPERKHKEEENLIFESEQNLFDEIDNFELLEDDMNFKESNHSNLISHQSEKEMQLGLSKHLWIQMIRLLFLLNGKKIHFELQNGPTQKNILLYAHELRQENKIEFSAIDSLFKNEESCSQINFWTSQVVEIQEEAPVVEKEEKETKEINLLFSGAKDENIWIFSPLNHFSKQQVFFSSPHNKDHFTLQRRPFLIPEKTCICPNLKNCLCQVQDLELHLNLVETQRDPIASCITSSYPFVSSVVEVTSRTPTSSFDSFRVFIPEVTTGQKTFEKITIPYMPQSILEKYLFALNSIFEKKIPSSVRQVSIFFAHPSVATLFQLYRENAIPHLNNNNRKEHTLLQTFSFHEWKTFFGGQISNEQSFLESMEKVFPLPKAKKNTNERMEATKFYSNYLRMLCSLGNLTTIKFVEKKMHTR